MSSSMTMMFVALIGSHHGRAMTTGSSSVTVNRSTYDLHQLTEDRPPSLLEEIDFQSDGLDREIGSDPTNNRTLLTQMLLRRTADTVSMLLPFITSADTRSQCFKHTAVYLMQLNNFKIWATKSEHIKYKSHLIFYPVYRHFVRLGIVRIFLKNITTIQWVISVFPFVNKCTKSIKK